MNKIVLVSDNENTHNEIAAIAKENTWDVIYISDKNAVDDVVKDSNACVFLFDCNSSIDNISVLRQLRISMQAKDIRTIAILPEENINYDILKYCNSYVNRPIDSQLFSACVNSALQLCETFKTLSKNNTDLAKSLYQLNVLYNTSTQLAGSLDKAKLIDIMTEGLDQSLSFSLSYWLIMNEGNDIKLIINSLFPISERLEKAIKLRALISYKNIFSINPSIEDIKVIKNIKDTHGEYDLNIFGYDNLFAPINIEDKFYGIIEVFRETDFAQEDAKCFTTLVKQVSLPLKSAILYEEVMDTNAKLEKLEKLKSEFISIVSHELKTPLASISSSLEIILKGSTGEINETMGKFLDIAKRNVTRLTAIIKDLLDLSKIEAGKLVFVFEKSNINQTVELVKNTLESWAKEQKITLKLNLEKDLDLVYIDAQRMEQVITNLVSNAIKFSKENGTVEITSSKISADEIKNNKFFTSFPEFMSNEYVKIAVKDNGIGIAQEDWGKVFEQFKQIENSLSRKVGGSGLGLPIAKRLMDAHRGFIWLESELNKGTTFYLAIPVMSEREIFVHSLEQDMQKAKLDHLNISLISLSENILEDKPSIIEKIKEENIIRKTSVTREHSYEVNGKRYYYFYAVDMESFVYDFQIRNLATRVNELNKENEEYDIMYSSALYPQDGEDIKTIFARLNAFSKGDMDEKDTDS
ncbi:HAMP domain-containing histidine kinase [bacterium]|nr:HAMP domain-containing histidine kinase [bacterium]